MENGARGESRRRLDGWKSIAAYFGRDRSTVSRWARDRALPIHQIPGGKTKTVFAFEDELAAWSQRNAPTLNAEPRLADPVVSHDIDAPVEAAEPPTPAVAASPQPGLATPGRQRSLRHWWPHLAGLALLGLILTLGAIAMRGDRARPSPALPEDPVVAQDYAEARNAWGHRTKPDLLRAMALYRSVIERDPDFAPARAGLAEAWLVMREYGDVGEAHAFGAARNTAQAALRLDPRLASAHRAIGFIEYWSERDWKSSEASFRRALELDPSDGQTAFWFANVLADMGRYAEAERQYAAAKIAMPGSQPLQVEYACAQWQAGRTARALRLLTELKTRYPDDPTVRDCLTWVHMTRADIRSYSRELTVLARLRGNPELIDVAARLERAVQADPASAHRVLIADALQQIEAGTRRIHSLPAFYAAAMRDRPALMRLMKDAASLGEQWYWPTLTRQMDAKWRGDQEVYALFQRLNTPPPGSSKLH